jgi:hypothetical protein
MSDQIIINNIETFDSFDSFENVCTEEELKDISGHLYCLFNVIFKFYSSDFFKLGKAFDLVKRLANYSTYYPCPSEMLETSSKFRNRHLAERVLFKKLAIYRDKQKREFFKCSTKIIKNAFNEIENLFLKYDDIEIAELYDIKLKTKKKKNIIKTDDDSVDEDDNISNDIEQYEEEDDDKLDNSSINIIINGNVNVNNKNYCCEKCNTVFFKKYCYEKHLKRKTPCAQKEKEKYDLDKKSCQFCSKVLCSVSSCHAHMTTCKYKSNDEIAELKQIVAELSKKMQNYEKKPKKK